MKKLLWILVLIFVYSCNQEPTTPDKKIVKPETELDYLVRNAGVLDKSVTEKNDKVSEKTLNDVVDNGKKWNVKETAYSLAKNLDKNILPFNPNTNTMWAGALVQGKEVPGGILSSLGDNLSRAPVTITVSSGGSYFGSETIDKPNYADYSRTVQEILSKKVTQCTAQQTLLVEVEHSKKQACIRMGFSANWLMGSIGSSFETNNSSMQKSVYLLFKQIYYTVSVNQPTNPSDYFGDDIKVSDLSYYVKSDNPLCYVSEVNYGRLILVKMTYNDNISSTDLDAKVRSGFSAFEAGGSYNTSFFEGKTTFSGLILGGSSGGAATALTSSQSSLEGILNLINNEANYNVNTPAYPISYVVKNLANNSDAKLGETTEYTVKEYTESSSNYQKFKIYLYGFYIINDCDVDFTDGDFYYSFDILDENNESLIGESIHNSQEIKCGDNSWIEIKEYTNTFDIIKSNGKYFKVVGFLYDQDTGLNKEYMCTFNFNLDYPWYDSVIANDPESPGYYKKDLFGSSTCNGTLYFQIIKL